MSREARKLALEALRNCHYYMIDAGLQNQSLLNEAFTAYMGLKAALAEQPAQQQETVFSFQMQLKPGWGSNYPRAVTVGEPDIESLFGKIGDVVTFYTSPPPQRKPLTDERIKEIYAEQTGFDLDSSEEALMDFARALLKENT